jgi:hypothetical protein
VAIKVNWHLEDKLFDSYSAYDLCKALGNYFSKVDVANGKNPNKSLSLFNGSFTPESCKVNGKVCKTIENSNGYKEGRIFDVYLEYSKGVSQGLRIQTQSSEVIKDLMPVFDFLIKKNKYGLLYKMSEQNTKNELENGNDKQNFYVYECFGGENQKENTSKRIDFLLDTMENQNSEKYKIDDLTNRYGIKITSLGALFEQRYLNQFSKGR